MKYKIERLKSMISHVILELLIKGELRDPRIPQFIEITRMTLSRDLRYSHIYFVNEELDSSSKEKAVEGLNNAGSYIQHEIAAKLELRYTPKLEFRYDYRDEKAYEVDSILDKISRELKDKESDKDEKKQ